MAFLFLYCRRRGPGLIFSPIFAHYGFQEKQTGAEALASQVREPKQPRLRRLPEEWPWLQMVLLVAVTFLVMSPSLQWFCQLGWWPQRLWKQDLDGPLNTKKISKIFQSTVIGNYNPLTIFSFAVEKHFSVRTPRILWRCPRRCTGPIWSCTWPARWWCSSFYAAGAKYMDRFPWALLFGIHPMRVESVAWITERKDVLFATFSLQDSFFIWRTLRRIAFYRTLLIFLLFCRGTFAKIPDGEFSADAPRDWLLERTSFKIRASSGEMVFLPGSAGIWSPSASISCARKDHFEANGCIRVITEYSLGHSPDYLFWSNGWYHIWHSRFTLIQRRWVYGTFCQSSLFLGVFAGLYIAWKKNYRDWFWLYVFSSTSLFCCSAWRWTGLPRRQVFTYVAYTDCFYRLFFICRASSHKTKP